MEVALGDGELKLEPLVRLFLAERLTAPIFVRYDGKEDPIERVKRSLAYLRSVIRRIKS